MHQARISNTVHTLSSTLNTLALYISTNCAILFTTGDTYTRTIVLVAAVNSRFERAIVLVVTVNSIFESMHGRLLTFYVMRVILAEIMVPGCQKIQFL